MSGVHDTDETGGERWRRVAQTAASHANQVGVVQVAGDRVQT